MIIECIYIYTLNQMDQLKTTNIYLELTIVNINIQAKSCISGWFYSQGTFKLSYI